MTAKLSDFEVVNPKEPEIPAQIALCEKLFDVVTDLCVSAASGKKEGLTVETRYLYGEALKVIQELKTRIIKNNP